MNTPLLQQPYPIGAFYKSVADAILEVYGFVQAPMSMTALSFLSTMSAATQRVADVQQPTGKKTPLSLFTVSIADSGERKTTVDDLVAEPLRQRDAREEHQFIQQRQAFESEQDLWQATRTALIRQIAKLTEKGKSTEAIEQKLQELDNSKPRHPRLRRLVRQDLTYVSLMAALEGDGESVFISSSEADAILKSELFEQHSSVLNIIWGSGSPQADRAYRNSTVTDPHCSISMLCQGEVFKELMHKHGEAFRGVGFFSRFLFNRPISMIGNRFVQNNPPQWNHLGTFHRRLQDLLDEGDMRLVAGVPRRIIAFDEEARNQWARRANEIESMLRDGGYLAEVRDFGSKLMEHVARVAGILHVFSRQEGSITTDTVERAFAIVWYHAEEFRLLFSPSLEVPQATIDADKVERYLLQSVWLKGWNAIPRNTLHRVGPVRGLNQFLPAIDVLISQGKISITQAKPKAPLIVNLNSAFFGQVRLT